MSVKSKREEEYLEAIFILSKRKRRVRVKDLSDMLKVKPSSVVEYLDKLARKGFIIYLKREEVSLTEKGREIVEKVYMKHVALKEFLMLLLKVPEEVAEEDACYIEHGIHDLTISRVLKFIEFVKNYPGGKPEFLKQLEHYYEYGEYLLD